MYVWSRKTLGQNNNSILIMMRWCSASRVYTCESVIFYHRGMNVQKPCGSNNWSRFFLMTEVTMVTVRTFGVSRCA